MGGLEMLRHGLEMRQRASADALCQVFVGPFAVAAPSTQLVRVFLGTFGRMGVYLSTPKTEKVSEDGENNKLKFGLSSTQGWRATMEDAHSALLDLDNDTAFLGVFDGHGGKVVAKFCAKYLTEKFSIVKPMQLVTWVLLSTELTSEWMK